MLLLRNGIRDDTAAAATAAAADVPDSFGGICGLFGGIGGGTPRPPTDGIIVFLIVAVGPPTIIPAGLPAGDADAFRTVAILLGVTVLAYVSGDGATGAAFAPGGPNGGDVIDSCEMAVCLISCPGDTERAIPVVGPETGTLETVAVG